MQVLPILNMILLNRRQGSEEPGTMKLILALSYKRVNVEQPHLSQQDTFSLADF